MKRMSVIVLFFSLLMLFSCRTVDFKRIHTEVEEVPSSERPVIEHLAEAGQENPHQDEEDTALLSPLYENGSLVHTESMEEKVLPDEKPEAEDAAKAIVREEVKEAEEPRRSVRLIATVSVSALTVIAATVFVLVRVSKRKDKRERKQPGFHYSFTERCYESYLDKIDVSEPLPDSCSEEENNPLRPLTDDPDEIISILTAPRE